MRYEGPREREYYPSPPKKQRMDYQEPERRPVPKYFQRAPEPKPAPVVIEKKPVLFNESNKNVLDYPPLPQRKPVQRPKVVPQPQPTKPIEKPPTKPVEKQPVKPVQTPMKPVEKQPMKTVEKPPIKPDEKQAITPNKATPPKPPIKTVQTTPVQKQTAQVMQKNQDVKPCVNNKLQTVKKEEDPPLGPCPEGYSQLSDLMSRALSDELRVIMDVVAKELPTQAPTPAERFIIKQLKTVVGDDIKKALGLNVTSRLLNVHNPLYVKLQFSGKPEAGRLQSFIKQYNISAFKRVEAPGDLFAARLDTVADFDCLCAAGEVSCGSAKVTVTPCYKYLACPPMLHTIYGTYTEPEKPEKQPEDTAKSAEADTSTEFKKIKQEKSTDCDALAIKQEVNNEVNENITVKQEVTNANDSDTNAKNSPIKINITIEAAPKSDTNKTINEKEIPEETAIDKLTKDIDKAINKLNKGIDKPINKQNKDIDKPINKPTEDIDKPIKEEKNVKKEYVEEDFGEAMNDSDILSLMSGGIVLDECSGSDDEK